MFVVPNIKFFHNSLQNSVQKSFQLKYFSMIKIKSFECAKSLRNHEKNNAGNIRLLVDDSFDPSTSQPSIIYCRLSDFMGPQRHERLTKPSVFVIAIQ